MNSILKNIILNNILNIIKHFLTLFIIKIKLYCFRNILRSQIVLHRIF